MRKTSAPKASGQRLTVDLVGLQELTGLGRASAIKVAQEAGAVISIGRRRLYHVDKIAKFMETLAGNE